MNFVNYLLELIFWCSWHCIDLTFLQLAFESCQNPCSRRLFAGKISFASAGASQTASYKWYPKTASYFFPGHLGKPPLISGSF